MTVVWRLPVDAEFLASAVLCRLFRPSEESLVLCHKARVWEMIAKVHHRGDAVDSEILS